MFSSDDDDLKRVLRQIGGIEEEMDFEACMAQELSDTVRIIEAVRGGGQGTAMAAVMPPAEGKPGSYCGNSRSLRGGSTTVESQCSQPGGARFRVPVLSSVKVQFHITCCLISNPAWTTESELTWPCKLPEVRSEMCANIFGVMLC